MNRLAGLRPTQKGPHPLGDAGQSFTLERIAHRDGQEEDRLGSSNVWRRPKSRPLELSPALVLAPFSASAAPFLFFRYAKVVYRAVRLDRLCT